MTAWRLIGCLLWGVVTRRFHGSDLVVYEWSDALEPEPIYKAVTFVDGWGAVPEIPCMMCGCPPDDDACDCVHHRMVSNKSPHATGPSVRVIYLD